MSTTIEGLTGDGHITGVPDAAAIEKLVNELFSALPNELPKANFSPDLGDHPKSEAAINLIHQSLPHLFSKDATLPTQTFPDVSGLSLPGSSPVSGFGRTPGGWEDLHTAGLGTIIPTGIGPDNIVKPASPPVSSLDLGGQSSHVPAFTDTPQNSQPFGSGAVPHSLAGSGLSPSRKVSDPRFSEVSPYLSDSSYTSGLNEVLKSFSSFEGPSQLPGLESDGLSQYYFLNQFAGATTPVQGTASNFPGAGLTNFDVNRVRQDFPILQTQVNGHQLVWFDNAATTQKPKQVIDRITYFYENENSNIHRAAHELAARATDAYEAARKKSQQFLNARSVNEIIFVRGATEAINLVAKTWGDQHLQAGDEIIVSNLEHHANIVPWQQLAARKGLKIKVIPVDDDGQILLDEYAKLLGPKTRLVSFTQVSNALGTVTPAKRIVELAHQAGAKVLVDGAQSVSHMRTDVQALDYDWFVFSGHKVFGPTGIGVLYGKEDLLNETQPWQGGGNMIVDVTFEYTKFHDAPSRFEAGTGNIADAVGLGAAIDYVNKLGIDTIHAYEHDLLVYATRLLLPIPGLRLIGTAAEKASVMSFVFEGYKTEEVGAALNKVGIAVRSGHHCAQPILRRFGVETTVRPSLAFYNTRSEVDRLVDTLYQLRSVRR